MTNLSKYRSLSIITAVALGVTWLLSMAALWNSLLTTEAKHEGWVVAFMIFVLFAGAYLFFLAYRSSDATGLEQAVKQAHEQGRTEVLQEIERKRKEENEKLIQETDLRLKVDTVLAGVTGTRNENTLCNKLLSSLSREMGFVQGIMYIKDKKEKVFKPAGNYALTERQPEPFAEGETLPGQAAQNKSITVLYDIPENYFTVASGLGNSQPGFLILAPIVNENESIGVLELAAFTKPDATTTTILENILTEVGPKLNKFITA
jgi:GAF domain-containing protein